MNSITGILQLIIINNNGEWACASVVNVVDICEDTEKLWVQSDVKSCEQTNKKSFTFYVWVY